jgi:hypothetical protein
LPGTWWATQHPIPARPRAPHHLKDGDLGAQRLKSPRVDAHFFNALQGILLARDLVLHQVHRAWGRGLRATSARGRRNAGWATTGTTRVTQQPLPRARTTGPEGGARHLERECRGREGGAEGRERGASARVWRPQVRGELTKRAPNTLRENRTSPARTCHADSQLAAPRVLRPNVLVLDRTHQGLPEADCVRALDTEWTWKGGRKGGRDASREPNTGEPNTRSREHSGQALHARANAGTDAIPSLRQQSAGIRT